MARPYPVSVLYSFHRSAAASQRRFRPPRKRSRMQHDRTRVFADMETPSAVDPAVRAADRGGLPLVAEAQAPHAAAASDRLGGQPSRLRHLHLGLRHRLKRENPSCNTGTKRNTVCSHETAKDRCPCAPRGSAVFFCCLPAEKSHQAGFIVLCAHGIRIFCNILRRITHCFPQILPL